MNVKNIEKNGNQATIVVEIDKELMETGVQKAYLKARKNIQLPGFRKCKAPRQLIEKMYGAHVFYEDGLEEIFPEVYQKAVVENAKHFAKALKAEGLNVQGDPANDYTETHQVIVSVGYGTGPDIADRLEQSNIIVNYQATPDEEAFTASGALRIGVNEMTRFGFGKEEFTQLAQLMADCILRNKDISEDVEKLRAAHTKMHYCFDDAEFEEAMGGFLGQIGL